MRTPMAIMASKGPVELLDVEREARSEVEAPRRSPAFAEALVEDWIWDAL